MHQGGTNDLPGPMFLHSQAPWPSPHNSASLLPATRGAALTEHPTAIFAKHCKNRCQKSIVWLVLQSPGHQLQITSAREWGRQQQGGGQRWCECRAQCGWGCWGTRKTKTQARAGCFLQAAAAVRAVTPCLPMGVGLLLDSLATAIPTASLSWDCAWTHWGNKGSPQPGLKHLYFWCVGFAAHHMCPLPLDGPCGEEAGDVPEHTSNLVHTHLNLEKRLPSWQGWLQAPTFTQPMNRKWSSSKKWSSFSSPCLFQIQTETHQGHNYTDYSEGERLLMCL